MIIGFVLYSDTAVDNVKGIVVKTDDVESLFAWAYLYPFMGAMFLWDVPL